MSEYKVRTFDGPVDIIVSVPGSKSMTNRALLLAALSDGKCVLRGAGMSDDSRVFLEALRSLGFEVDEKPEDENEIVKNSFVTIVGCSGQLPCREASVYVGSAGTAARFLTAMMGLSDGVYEVSSSEQMKGRPMRELIEALETLGAEFEFVEDAYSFPSKVYGRKYKKDVYVEKNRTTVNLNIDRSSQFLSALLLCGPMVEEGFDIRLTGTRQARSYVKISEKMMREFGYTYDIEIENDLYRVAPNTSYYAREYDIEPDVSAACYFYAMVAANGGRVVVKGVKKDNSQGDMKFLSALVQMGCEIRTTSDDDDIIVYKDPNKTLHGIEINMSDFSDQTMTLAAIAPFADSPTTITEVAHIRGQESDRISAIVTELTRLGIRCEEYPDGVKIYPIGNDVLKEKSTFSGKILVNTYNDHRMAMSFAVLGTALPGVIIDNPECCRKTFGEFFDVLNHLY